MAAKTVDNQAAGALKRLSRFLGDAAYSPRPGVLPIPMLVSAGVERQHDPRRYRWDGMRRGHDVKCPQGVAHAIIQYTLAGSGRYADLTGEHTVPTGHAFIALVPSAHRYWLPEGGTPWSFCWFAVAHPQIMDRLQSQVKRHGAVFDTQPESALAQRLLDVVDGLFRRTFIDDFAIEGALWDFVAEFDRHHDRLARPPANKQALLDRVRALVMADLSEPLGATEIAQRIGWHRVYFAERFRASAGFPPGAFITSLRLDEARRLLRNETSTLAEVAHAVGLGSASRLCRLFRRHFGATPGAYRG